MSDSLRPHGLQHARLPCLSPTPGAYSNSCPLSRWCHPTISSSVIPFSSHLQSFPASGSSSRNQFFASGCQSPDPWNNSWWVCPLGKWGNSWSWLEVNLEILWVQPLIFAGPTEAWKRTVPNPQPWASQSGTPGFLTLTWAHSMTCLDERSSMGHLVGRNSDS